MMEDNGTGTGGGAYSPEQSPRENITSTEYLISPNILRGLGDRSYDKRKAAALELTSVIRTLQENTERDKIANIINILAQEFVRSRNAHQRKGGLIGLAACAIGFMTDIQRYLHLLLPPVIECFDDQESRVCYYACESLYNISKVARNHVLRYFNQIFDGLCKLFAHADVDVKNGANLLDRLLKDIITETDITFDLETFLPLLQKHIKRTKPYIRQLIIGWISILHNVRHINLLAYLPEFLEGVFNMLSDPNREIRQGADTILSEFMRDIKKNESFDYGPLVTVVVCLLPSPPSLSAAPSHPSLSLRQIGQTKSKEKYNRLTALHWLVEFIFLGGENLVTFFPAILGSIMFCISDTEPDICKVAQKGNEKFMELVRSTETQFPFGPIVRTSTLELLAPQVPPPSPLPLSPLTPPQVTTRIAALVWIKMLHEKNPTELNQLNDIILPALFKALSDSSEDVVLVDLQVRQIYLCTHPSPHPSLRSSPPPLR
jgi:vacuole morphology and inheritance protein 14